MSRSPTPGARESNAGDEFHVLWAARRVVRLLDSRSKLHRVFVEGVAAEDDPTADDLLLGVDLSEYYGADTFDEVECAVVSQLKYSTRHPERSWTAARMAEGKVRVVRRLADSFTYYYQKYGREATLTKLTVRLVSNQPLDTELSEALTSAQLQLKDRGQVGRQWLLGRLKASNRNALERLSEASGLRSRMFADFLRVLNLSGSGAEPRLFQQIRLLQDIGRTLIVDLEDAYRRLYELVTRHTMPEAEGGKGIRREDVLVALGVPDEGDFFPAPSRLETVANPIQTGEVKSLAQAILESPNRQILAHGDAGVGKTTTVQQLPEHLPLGSVVIMYDCFGGGEYKVAGGERHTPPISLRQQVNELALRCGTPFLVPRDLHVQDLWRKYRCVMETAARVVGETGGILVIAIDAADNSVLAAREMHEDCFVPQLWTVPLPATARLLMMARSHRRGWLKAPDCTPEFEITGFTEAASAEHLRRTFPNVDEDSCRRFHRRTEGNPRSQFYHLDRAKQEGPHETSLQHLMKTAKRTPGEIFDDLYEAAVKHAHDPKAALTWTAELLALARPVPVTALAEALGMPVHRVLDFCRALRPGLTITSPTGESIEALVDFRDEDFETYLRDQIGEGALKSAHQLLGAHFLERAETDPFAARTVATHLAAADRHDDLIALALYGPRPAIIQDDFVSLDVQRKRIAHALRASAATGRTTEGTLLVLAAAELARTDGALTSVVHEEPGLAAQYGNDQAVVQAYFGREDEPGYGRAHLHAAAAFGRIPETRSRAQGHLRQAEACLRQLFAVEEHERSWEPEAEDVARGVEAVFWIRGAEEAARWVRAWRPRTFQTAVVYGVGAALAPQLGTTRFEEVVHSLGLPALAEAVLFAAAWESGERVPGDKIQRTLLRLLEAVRIGRPHLLEAIRRGRRHDKWGEEWAIGFAELAAQSGECSGQDIRDFLNFLGPRIPQHTPHPYTVGTFEPGLRAASLCAAVSGQDLQAEDLMPEKYRKAKQVHEEGSGNTANSRSRSDLLRRWNETIGRVLPAFVLRARTLVSHLSAAEVAEDLAAQLEAFRQETKYRRTEKDMLFGLWSQTVTEALAHAVGLDEVFVEAVADLALLLLGDGAPGKWLAMANPLLQQDEKRSVGLGLLDRAARYVCEQNVPGSERWGVLLRGAVIVHAYDQTYGRELYLRAVEAAADLDDDAAHLLALHARLAQSLSGYLKDEEAIGMTARLSRTIEAHEPLVSETSVLPYQATVQAVATLDVASGLALCSRWDDEERLDLATAVAQVVRAVSRTDALTPAELLPLLHFDRPILDVDEDVVPILDRLHETGVGARPALTALLDYLSLRVRRDVPLATRARTAGGIVRWAKQHQLRGLPGVEALQQVVSFADDIAREERASATNVEQSPSWGHREAELKRQADQERLQAEKTLKSTIRDGHFQNLADHLEAVGLSGSRIRPGELLAKLAKAVPPARRTHYLDALVGGLGTRTQTRILLSDLLKALRSALETWGHAREIQKWAKSGIPAFIERCLPDLLAFDHVARDQLRAVLALPYAGADPIELTLPAIAAHVTKLTSFQLFTIADIFADSQDAAERHQVLEASLARREQVLRDLPGLPETARDREPLNALAAFFWSVFGHPDRRERWRVLHAARAVLRLTTTARAARISGALVRLGEDTTAGAYRSPERLFYWMSARTTLLVLLQRLAVEQDTLVHRHAKTLSAWALNRSFPHAQIRELARQAALTLLGVYPDAYDRETAEILALANTPRSCSFPRDNKGFYRWEEQDWKATADASQDSDFWGFDTSDTMPYWFKPLARKFGVLTAEVRGRAAVWVCERWGFTKADWWEDPRELGRANNEEVWETYSSKGSIPPVESLRLYAEYHALQCVAGELADEGLSLQVESWDDPDDPWRSWLERHLPARQDVLLVDLKQPTPLRPEWWGRFPAIECWRRYEDLAEYDRALGLVPEAKPSTERCPPSRGCSELVVRSEVDEWDAYRYGTETVASALVTHETSLALLRAFQTTPPNEYRLPDEGHDESYGAVDEAGFRLVGWVGYWESEDALDHHDPLRKDHSRHHFYELGEDFRQVMELVGGPLRWTVGTSADPVARLEVWSDNPKERHRISTAFSVGQRLWIQLDTLLAYLRKKEMDLILKVQFRRNLHQDYRDREKNYEHDFGRALIYLLGQDGTLETLADSRRLRAADRQ